MSNSNQIDSILLAPSDYELVQFRNKSNGIMEYLTKSSFRKSLDV